MNAAVLPPGGQGGNGAIPDPSGEELPKDPLYLPNCPIETSFGRAGGKAAGSVVACCPRLKVALSSCSGDPTHYPTSCLKLE